MTTANRLVKRVRGALYHLPLRVKQAIYWRPYDTERRRQIRRELAYLSWADRQRVRKLRNGRGAATGQPARVTVRTCGELSVELRPGTSDADVLWDTFVGEYHLPLGAPRTVLDLGANIGLTAAHFAHLYPTARIVSVELDADLAAIARRHTMRWEDRIEIVCAAVWKEDGEISYSIQFGEEYGARVAKTGNRTAPAVSMATLIGDGTVDYVKMDIEGAEGVILEESQKWARRVREIAVEVHPPASTVFSVSGALEAAGFETTPIGAHFAAVRGVRS